MVFCYKIITDTPRRSRSVSPRKSSPTGRSSVSNTVSEFISSYDYETNKTTLWDSIPERDWKLLAALARKREEEDERARLAEQFQKMWLKEKEEREMVEAETSEQYKRYLHEKRSQEQYYQEFKRLQRMGEQQLKKRHLLNCIKDKEQRSAELLAWQDDQKITHLIGKAVEEEARAQLAKDRRHRQVAADQWKKNIELVHALKKSDDANRRRRAILRDASQRVAIANALTTWETSLARQELAVHDANRRGRALGQCALAHARGMRVTRARERGRQRARRIAAITALMRDAVRSQDNIRGR